MNPTNIYKISLGLAAACLITFVILIANGTTVWSGPFLITFFIALAVGFRGFALLKGFTYTIMIFAAVTTALYYPGYFIEWNGFKLTVLITPLIQLIMFWMGT